MAKSLEETVTALWSAAASRWHGEAAQVFYEDYILRLTESAQRQDALGTQLSQELQQLDADLSAAEAELYT